jgi:hypothetical protein
MVPFRHNQEVRTAQAALDAYTAGQIKAGDHEITPQYEQLNQNVNDALKAEEEAEKRR